MRRPHHQTAHAEADQVHRLTAPSNLGGQLGAKLLKGNAPAGVIMKHLRRPAPLAQHVEQPFKPPGPAPDTVEHECQHAIHLIIQATRARASNSTPAYRTAPPYW